MLFDKLVGGLSKIVMVEFVLRFVLVLEVDLGCFVDDKDVKNIKWVIKIVFRVL